MWLEIVKEFKIKKYHVDEHILDRKIRNMKQFYRDITDNNKNGHGQIVWQWYDNMDYILNEDIAIDKSPTLSSMAAVPNIIRDLVTAPSTSTSSENIGMCFNINIHANKHVKYVCTYVK